ncbi:MAG: YheT family hydrolase [Nitrospinales bacterium]
MARNAGLPSRVRHDVRIGPRGILVLLELVSPNPHAPLVLLAHGMGGCSESGYMKRIAGKLHAAGFGVFMMNHRGSGPGMGVCDSLWNGGSSGDLEKVVQTIAGLAPGRPLLLVGFSLSGNILLKYLGEGRTVPAAVTAALAVNPPVDLRTASRLLSEEKHNRIFNWYYMKLLNNQAAALARAFPDAFRPPPGLGTIWEFDAAYTAPAAGYKDEEDYYQQCSAGQFLENIELPTTILCAADDPFIPPAVFENTRMSKAIRYIAPAGGGHMGYIARNNGSHLADGRWMDYFVSNWAAGQIQDNPC